MQGKHLGNRLDALLRPEVLGLALYDPGADPDTLLRQYGLGSVIKLSNNENPYGLSPLAAQAMQRRIALGLGRYPDPSGKALCAMLARKHDVAADRVMLGNGSENLLELLCQALLGPGDRVLTQAPGFSLHEIYPRMMGAHVHKVPCTDTFGFAAAAWRQALAGPLKLVFISNPCNPLGTAYSTRELQTIIRCTPPDCLLVIDEAYFEYAIACPGYPDALALLRTHARPWMVLRTFSKAYGLASLRVGYGIASEPGLIEALHRVRTPYNVNLLAQEAACAALEDTPHLEKSVALVTRERARLTQALRDAGLRVAPSMANFLFVDTGTDARQVVQALHRHGVIVKAWAEPGYQTFIRVSLALPADNDAFLRALLHVVAPA